ncbi:hypothetical protein FHG87_004713 [Trinorchestia longiramus]|nr:hypothetical protein FHG87_004713 [Trinorchestia longiramus]
MRKRERKRSRKKGRERKRENERGGTDTYTRTSGRVEKQVPPKKVAAQKTVLFSNPARRPHDGIDTLMD